MEGEKMLQDFDFYCALQGTDFDPMPFVVAGKFEILEHNRVGEIAQKGRFKDRPLDFGYVRFKSKEDDFEKFVSALYDSKRLIIESKSELRELHIFLGYEGQCNWEIVPNMLKIIGELGLTLTITCAEADDAG
jgi:hypothetical protein